MPLIHPVILSGGSGTRLWPLSRSLFPKQLLALTGEQSLIQDTALRTAGADFTPPFIICNTEHRFLIAEQMREAGIKPQAIVLEPVGRNTAPAAAIAALIVAEKSPDGLILLMPADHIVRNRTAFLEAVARAARCAQQDHLVTFGITPDSPETGYGYIRRGAPLTNLPGSFAVARFVEKPDAATAANYLASGEYDWNSGMFLFKASMFLAELERLEPELLSLCREALAKGAKDLDFFRLDATVFAKARGISIDYAVMERTSKAAVVPVEMGWSDIGSWEALWTAANRDALGNAIKGDVLHHGTRNSYLRSEGPLVAAVGVEDMVVVATQDAVLVSHKSASQDVKRIVEQLERSGRELHTTHRKVYRPWGSYESIDNGDKFQVKHIIVNPGAKLSLQMHHKRAEHWIVVSGTALVTCDDKVFPLKENESTFIPLGSRHRLENRGTEPLHLIEVQSGSYLGEDDIVRFEDTYGRN
ncbi:MAG TPA: mannose-1-phosphate guanylyltransferase/mannose-6-phosphate isomerase [Rhizomicrobium sp.]|nr:mannose-1-phosphate guanylyltransferase/mannose-6-phosphate isomerase [Rhizomicrobium sp.]